MVYAEIEASVVFVSSEQIVYSGWVSCSLVKVRNHELVTSSVETYPVTTGSWNLYLWKLCPQSESVLQILSFITGQNTEKRTYIYVPTGIRTHDSSVTAVQDHTRPIPVSH
jgi:hypothetical protein